jgi:hypothetical protein
MKKLNILFLLLWCTYNERTRLSVTITQGEQTNKRTNERTNKRTNKQTNKRKNGQTDKRTNERTNEQTNTIVCHNHARRTNKQKNFLYFVNSTGTGKKIAQKMFPS